ncbi:hypothetical protein A0H81_14655 [Grifola frondosa]|uniref:Uncharacterized protein n=1 Tax=Grifola frondosa TaxID=5627 RepID=A0A1C7LN47_GRIFR|nr:hypothetical protein A0H81_14655 [Grifola frondosa]
MRCTARAPSCQRRPPFPTPSADPAVLHTSILGSLPVSMLHLRALVALATRTRASSSADMDRQLLAHLAPAEGEPTRRDRAAHARRLRSVPPSVLPVPSHRCCRRTRVRHSRDYRDIDVVRAA